MFQEKETLQEGDHNETVIISKAKVAALGQVCVSVNLQSINVDDYNNIIDV